MTGTLARFLATIAQIASGAGAFILSADAVPFGLDARDVGLACVWAGTFATIAVIAIRGNWLPGITTGIGTEPQGTTTTTTVSEATTTIP